MGLLRIVTALMAGIGAAGYVPRTGLAQAPGFAQNQLAQLASSVSPSPLAQQAHLRIIEASIADALAELQARSGVALVFSPQRLPAKGRVACACETASVSEALDRILAGTGLGYSLIGETIIIVPTRAVASPLPALSRVISGTVVDSTSGVPVEAGNVTIVGTTNSVNLRSNGTFSITAPDDAVALLVRSIGYVARTVSVPAGQNSVHVVLWRDVFKLEQLVITGEASGVERKNLANSVAVVDATTLGAVPSQSVENALQGVVPSVHISENSGAPGGGNVVRIRGVTSINGAFTPLYVVDGVIMSDVTLGTGTNAIQKANGSSLDPQSGNEDNDANRIADLNPNDIENIQILRGASASAIYGSKAANGVVIITTKQGQTGAPRFDFTQRFGASTLDHEFGHRCFTSSAEAVSVWGAQAANTWTPACYDWEKQLYGGSAPARETSISVSGATENTKYYASLFDSHTDGIVPNTDAGKQSLRLNLDQRFGSKFDIAIGAEAILSQRNPGEFQNGNAGLPVGGSIAYGGASWLNLQQMPNGTFPANPFAVSNPFQTVAMFQNSENVSRQILSERLTYNLLETNRQKLQFISSGGLDMFVQKNFVLAPPALFEQQAQSLPGESALSYGQSTNGNINANLVHTYTWTDGTTATSQLGMEYLSQSLDDNHTLSQGLIGGLTNIDQGLAVSVQEYRTQVREMGLFAQEEFLTLQQRLLLTLGARMDQSSNNGDPKELFFYPKASVSYRLPVLPRFVDELKLRFAYGYSGNEPLYGQKFTELTAGNIAGSIPILGINGNTGASNLQPERQREIETGFDATLLHSRLNIEATVYEKTVTQLLLQETLAPSTGYSSLYFNGGQMRNRGVELSLTGLLVQKGKLEWRSTPSYYMSRCIIQSLPVPAFRPASTINSATFGYTFIQPGRSCTQVYGRDTLGSQKGDAALGTIGTQVTRAVADDNPNWNASWSNQVDYGRFHLRVLMDEQKGGILVNITEYEYDVTKDSPDYLVARKPGQLTGAQRQAAFAKSSLPYIQDDSYFKLREVSLSVDLPEPMIRWMWTGVRSVSVELSGRNLLTQTPYRSTADPEANQIPRSAALGVPWDIWAYPPSRTYYFTIHIGTH